MTPVVLTSSTSSTNSNAPAPERKTTMTTNITRAADTLKREGLFDAEAHCYAQVLADAGLLAPDLPEPVENEDNGNPSWFNGWVEQDWGEVELHFNGYADDEEEATFTAEDARALAHALLAAADHAEERQ